KSAVVWIARGESGNPGFHASVFQLEIADVRDRAAIESRAQVSRQVTSRITGSEQHSRRIMFLDQSSDCLRRREGQIITIDWVGGTVDFACAILGECLGCVLRSGAKKHRLGFTLPRRLGEHLEGGRSNFIVAELRVNPNNVCHLNHLDLSKKVSDLL